MSTSAAFSEQVGKTSIHPVKVSIRTNICLNLPHDGICLIAGPPQGVSLSSVVLTNEVVGACPDQCRHRVAKFEDLLDGYH